MDWLAHHWGIITTIVWVCYSVVITCMILLERRTPVATIAWILFLNFLPLIGLYIYYIFGPRKIRRERKAREYSRMVLEHERHLEHGLVSKPELNDQQEMISHLARGTAHMPLSYATDYKVLIGGVATFEAIYEAIEKARSTVFLEYYIFDPDETGTRFRDLLTRKAQEGVKIYLLVDALASMKLRRTFFRDFIAAGGKLEFFHSFNLKTLQSIINMRNHRKLVVCDGQVAFTGGVNITDDENRSVNPKAYHDMHIQVSGPIVHWLELLFAEDWMYASNDPTIQQLITKSEKAQLQDDNELEKELQDNPSLSVRPMQLLVAGPDNEHAPILKTMVAAMYMAKERIYLTTPYLIPDESAFIALTSAVQRGVDVKILVPKEPDSFVVRQAAQSWFEDLIGTGIEIYEFMPYMLHSKALVIDDNVSIIGTSNFDYRSFYLNFEMSLLCFTNDVNTDLTEEFLACLEKSEKVELVKLPLHKRLMMSAARVLSPIL